MADTSITSNVQDGAGIVSNIVSGVSVTGQIATGAKGDKGDKGDTGTTDHLLLTNIGTNTHAQIDTAITASTSHIANTSNPHSVTKAQVGLSNVPNTDFTAAVAANTAKLTADTANVTAAGALMDSEVTNLAQVKAFSSSDYATSAQGTASSSHIANTSNPHSVTKTQVGLGNADNTSDADKPVSTAQQTALNLKANQSTTYTKTEVDGLNTAHLAALDPHPQYLNDIEGDTRYANSPYAVMAKSQFANLATSYGLLGQTYGNSGYGNDFTVYGNSTQASTPTPDVPVAITSTTGNVTVRSDNKNFISFTPFANTTTNGVTRTYNSDGSITINGTATGALNLVHTLTTPLVFNGPVIHSIGVTSPNLSYFSLNNNSSTMISNGEASQIFTGDGTTAFTTYLIYIGTGSVFNNLTIKPQVEAGSVATSYVQNIRSTQTLPLATTQLRSLPNGVSDRIYKSGGSWWMEQNVLTYTPNSSATVTVHYSSDATMLTFRLTRGDIVPDGSYAVSTLASVRANRFVATSWYTQNTVVFASEAVSSHNSSQFIYMTIARSRLVTQDVAGFKTWLDANSTNIDYQTTAPVTTAITDPSLITALESIRTYQGITNITASTPVSGSYGLDLTTALAGKADASTAVTLTGTQTITNKTLTSPKVNGQTPTTNLATDIGSAALYYSNLFARRQYLNSTAYFDGSTAGRIATTGLFMPVQATTAGAPAYVKGAMYFDTTLNKLRIGGATAWETVTST